MANKAFSLPSEVLTRPHLSLIETWQDEVTGIDTAIWAVTNPAGGINWAINTGGQYNRVYMGITNGNGRLRGVQRWTAFLEGTNLIMRRLSMEWVMQIGSPDLAAAACFFGLGALAASVRTSNDIVGFILGGTNNASFVGVMDDGGTEGTSSAFGVSSDLNKLKLELSGDTVRLFVNESQVWSRRLANFQPGLLFPHFYLEGDGADIYIGQVRIWTEDFVS